jgi:hypothetical protein
MMVIVRDDTDLRGKCNFLMHWTSASEGLAAPGLSWPGPGWAGLVVRFR